MHSAAKPKNEKYVNDYLVFLGLMKQPPSLAYLSQLMEAHICKVPFDGSNFTLHHPEGYSLNNREILAGFKKGNGGICYQENGAFKRLLYLLGFKVTLASATMFRFGRDNPLPYAEMGRDVHCAILVVMEDKEYLVDLSWGNAFRRPLEVGGLPTDIPGEDKRQCIKKADVYQLKVEFDGKWEVEYQFKNANKKTKDFADNVRFLATDKHSDLSQALLLMRRLPNMEFEYIRQEIYKNNSGSLFFHHKSPIQGKTIKTEIKDQSTAKEKLKEYGVNEANSHSLLSICGFKSA